MVVRWLLAPRIVKCQSVVAGENDSNEMVDGVMARVRFIPPT
jgi:hypothetical protein